MGSKLGRRIDDCLEACLARFAYEKRDSGGDDGPTADSLKGVFTGGGGVVSGFRVRGVVAPGVASVSSPGNNALPVFLRLALFTVSTGCTANFLGFFSVVPLDAVRVLCSPFEASFELLVDSSTGSGAKRRRGFSVDCSLSCF